MVRSAITVKISVKQSDVVCSLRYLNLSLFLSEMEVSVKQHSSSAILLESSRSVMSVSDTFLNRLYFLNQ